MQNDSTDQLIGALDLNHNGGDVVGGLRETEGKTCNLSIIMEVVSYVPIPFFFPNIQSYN